MKTAVCTMVDVLDFEEISTPDDNNRHFDVLLSCGHVQSIESHMPTPPKRIMCKDCMDEEKSQ